MTIKGSKSLSSRIFEVNNIFWSGTFGDAKCRGPDLENYQAPSFTDETYEF